MFFSIFFSCNTVPLRTSTHQAAVPKLKSMPVGALELLIQDNWVLFWTHIFALFKCLKMSLSGQNPKNDQKMHEMST